jgi:hypothetical protein
MSAKAAAVIRANMARFAEAQAAMPWFGLTSHAEIDSDWEAVERWDRIMDLWDGLTDMTVTKALDKRQ